MEKKRNLWVIPTNKPSRLFKDNLGYYFSFENLQRSNFTNQNIYITSDEEIKEGDWCIEYDDIDKKWLNPYKPTNKSWDMVSKANYCRLRGTVKKIILTTDQDLIKDGVQGVDDNFLEWFVKNPSCEYIEIENVYDKFLNGDKRSVSDFRKKYKINIPKEEPKQDLEKEMFDLEQELDIPSNLRFHNSKPKKETLEEAAEREGIYRASQNNFNQASAGYNAKWFRRGALFGHKWQQERMYSEEEVVNILIKAYEDIGKRKIPTQILLASWFKQFKKK